VHDRRAARRERAWAAAAPVSGMGAPSRMTAGVHAVCVTRPAATVRVSTPVVRLDAENQFHQ
jgi:hypothetical protein